METDPTDSPVAAKSIRVPPIVPTLVLYGACIVIGAIPNLFPGDPNLRNYWLALPVGLATYGAQVFLFSAAFAINEKRAIIVPICGVFAAALLDHFFLRLAGDYAGQGLEQVQLRSDLWNAIKFSLSPALFVAGLGIVAARWWAPRTQVDPERFVIPPLMPALVVFAIGVAIEPAITVASSRGLNIDQPLRMIQMTASSVAIIAMCFVAAVALSGWSALLPLIIVSETFVLMQTLPQGCSDGSGNSDCWNFFWPLLRVQIVALAVFWALSVFAGAWGREKREA